MLHIPWYVAGPLMGLVVTATYAVANRPLGALGSYAQVVDFVRQQPVKEIWRVWYLVGVILGGTAASWIFGIPEIVNSYGKLGSLLSAPLLLPLLFVGGICIGFGARWMGGCTSGHGLCGTSSRSVGSFAATISFMASAIVVTLLIHKLSGGIL
jgi:uncharacterized membrane protein YedE/YeeE